MKKWVVSICMALVAVFGMNPGASTEIAEAASVYAYSGKGITLYVDTSSITQTKGGFAVYVGETNGGTYSLMQFYKDLGDWKFTSQVCGKGYVYDVAPARAVFNVCQQYL